MRVIAGAARGRRLAVPAGRATRPTSDRAREALFSTLESLRGPLSGCRFLDLYAGSGAVGLEAASRGADEVLLVESSRRAVRVAEANVQAVGLTGVHVRQGTVESVLAAPPPDGFGPYDVVFADPPYDMTSDAMGGVLRSARHGKWLSRDAVVVVERASRSGEFVWPDGYVPERFRRYGEGTLWYGRAAGSGAGPAGAGREEEP